MRVVGSEEWERRPGGPMKWAERLAQAERVGRFTLEDRAAAGMWSCCPVGETCAKRGVELKFSLKDDQLYDLGMAFDDAVCNDEVAAAYALYLRIIQAVP